MNHLITESLGWTATAVFVGSYFFERPSVLRGVQMIGALLWISYGVMIDSMPVMVANVLVFSAAAWTVFRRTAATKRASCDIVEQPADPLNLPPQR